MPSWNYTMNGYVIKSSLSRADYFCVLLHAYTHIHLQSLNINPGHAVCKRTHDAVDQRFREMLSELHTNRQFQIQTRFESLNIVIARASIKILTWFKVCEIQNVCE
ncbi:Hypothetical_protein [Hexamita inflata]|uniref:Hypothetical_protein n=1 Tax=Hexamita inflata TaxID=28002 RepID=A0AA86VC79_9EUKA|nr:Hypothetical protein HINF_LOCUS50223 [Hexamita inflata]CAI9962580.1 Hypothetical protein HINF_LOCUS50225 [Hexamita inflata]